MRVRLNLTLPELEEGLSIQRGTKDRLNTIRDMAMRRLPMAIAPMPDRRGKQISAVLLTDEIAYHGKGGVEVRFRPIWCRTFALCSKGKDSIKALALEFECGKYWVDITGARQTDQTMSGNGCDPAVVRSAETFLGDLLFEAEERPEDVLRNAISLIQRSF